MDAVMYRAPGGPASVLQRVTPPSGSFTIVPISVSTGAASTLPSGFNPGGVMVPASNATQITPVLQRVANVATNITNAVAPRQSVNTLSAAARSYQNLINTQYSRTNQYTKGKTLLK